MLTKKASDRVMILWCSACDGPVRFPVGSESHPATTVCHSCGKKTLLWVITHYKEMV